MIIMVTIIIDNANTRMNNHDNAYYFCVLVMFNENVYCD